MQIAMYQVDAFANRVFEGNPAAVCVLDDWLDESLMQAIAQENNLAETAFCVARGDTYEIRWFTPEVEVDLCGHATLAAAYIFFEEIGVDRASLEFHSKSGPLKVSQAGELYTMDFPAEPPLPCEEPPGLAAALGCEIIACHKNIDYLIEVPSEKDLASIEPIYGGIADLDARGVIVTAKSEQYDFVNRFFAPAVGIDEDPVTGSAFTKLIPFWAEKLDRDSLSTKQISKRGGEVFCQMRGKRVSISGKAVLFARAKISIN